MDMGKNTVANLSSFFLFEETGDSEVLGDDPGKHPSLPDDENENNNDKKDTDEDDAGSCYYDSSYSGSNPPDDEFDECDCDSENEEAPSDDDNVKKQLPIRYEKWEIELYSDTASTADLSGYLKNSSSCISVDTAKESLSEAEKNRRFWEACLAS